MSSRINIYVTLNKTLSVMSQSKGITNQNLYDAEVEHVQLKSFRTINNISSREVTKYQKK